MSARADQSVFVSTVEGLNFTLHEEYHVVHHQYAGTHWSRSMDLYLKHMEQYKACVPTAFYKQNLGFIFGYIITQDYEKLADVFYKPFIPEGMTKQELTSTHGLAQAALAVPRTRAGQSCRPHPQSQKPQVQVSPAQAS
jgi:hypothetical protein